MTLRLMGRDVAVIPVADPDQTSEGGLWIPEQAKQRIDQGIVKYTGPEVRDVSRGDHVQFTGYSGQKASIEDEGVLYFIHESEILCVYEGEGQPMILRAEVLQFIDNVEKKLKTATYDFDHNTIDKILEQLRSEIKDFFHAEGLEF